MYILIVVILSLIFNTTPIERTELALDLLNRAYPQWEENYKLDEFDCSEMSAFVSDYLAAWQIVTGCMEQFRERGCESGIFS